MWVFTWYLKYHWREFDLWLYKQFDYGLFELKDFIINFLI